MDEGLTVYVNTKHNDMSSSRVQDCILFRGCDLQSLAQSGDLSWLPDAATLGSYRALIDTPLAPNTTRPQPALWAPLLMLPAPAEALLMVSTQLQAAVVQKALPERQRHASAGRTAGRPVVSQLALNVGKAVVEHCNLKLVNVHLDAMARASSAAVAAKDVARAVGQGQREVRAAWIVRNRRPSA